VVSSTEVWSPGVNVEKLDVWGSICLRPAFMCPALTGGPSDFLPLRSQPITFHDRKHEMKIARKANAPQKSVEMS
jgi:hypothetical protein